MQSIVRLLIIFTALLAAVYVSGANLNGEWTDITVQSKAVIVQKGNQVDITNSFMWKGKDVEWKATGVLRGCGLSLRYWYTRNMPEGWEPGTMDLRLVDSKTLTGCWVSENKKYRQNITLKYVRPLQSENEPGK